MLLCSAPTLIDKLRRLKREEESKRHDHIKKIQEVVKKIAEEERAFLFPPKKVAE